MTTNRHKLESSRKNSQPVAVFWFRRDLRLFDNVGLAAALKRELPVLPLFIFDSDILEKLEDRDDRRVQFIHQTIVGLNKQLEDIGSALLVRYGKPAEVFKKLQSEFQIKAVYTNHDYEPYATQRDSEIFQMLKAGGATFSTFKDQVIFEKLEVEKGTGGPYTVFTPYSKKWLSQLDPKDLRSHKLTDDQFLRWSGEKIPSLEEMGFKKSDLIFPDSAPDKKLLKRYHELRNTPSVKGTSRLGLHLRFGTVSVREMAKLAREVAQDTGDQTWLKELIWREFFMQILWHFPHVVKGAFRPEYDRIQFRHDKKDFSRWCEGTTGYPIVDAGMRELNATGFMHNRVRMIAASFLVKHLLVDWRWGEAYFARKLLDFELASNNGNWQWVAGTGCDASPYFRVFNPETQAKKFDPKKEYINFWVPEAKTNKYPEPMIDHVTARLRVLRAYKIGLGKKAPEPTQSAQH